MKWYQQILDANGWLLFALFFLASFLLTFVDIEFVSTDQVYEEYFHEMLDKKYGSHDEFVSDFEDDLAELDLDDNSIDWQGVLLDAGFILLKFVFSVPLVAALFLLGFLFERKYEHFRFESLFKATMLANFVFLLPTLLMVLWFLFFQTDYSYKDLEAFGPLSLINWIDSESIPSWLIGLVELINLYELLFVVLVAYGLAYFYQLPYKIAFTRVGLVYAGGIFFWHVLWLYIASTLN